MAPENHHFDFKSLPKVTGKTAAWCELALDCVAFATAQGGSLLIGIEDRQDVPQPGTAVPRGLAEDLEQKCRMGARKEFQVYSARTCRKIKGTRLGVLRADCGAAWASKDYGTTISVANKLLQAAPQEDDKLLLWCGQALTRKEANA